MGITEDKISKLLYEAFKRSKSYTSRNFLNKSPNPLMLKKWYKSEIHDICGVIERIEANNDCESVCEVGCCYFGGWEQLVLSELLGSKKIKNLYMLPFAVLEILSPEF